MIMKEIIDKRKDLRFFLVVSVFLSLVFGSLVSGFGVVSPSLEMYPGQVKDTHFILQNVIEGEGDLTIQVSLTEGSEIVTLSDSDLMYDVPFGSEVKVNIRVEIPESAPVGSEYRVEGLFRPVVSSEGDDVQIVTNIGVGFDVTVVERPVIEQPAEPAGTGGNVWLWVLVIIVVLLVVWWLLRKKKA